MNKKEKCESVYIETLDKILREMVEIIIDEDIKVEDLYKYSYETPHGIIYTDKKMESN